MASDAIDELVARSNQHPELQTFHEFHRANPHVLDFLVHEIQLRIDSGFDAFSFGSLWDYARWKLQVARRQTTFQMNDHMMPFYARAIVILHPEFNGRAEFRGTLADEVYGLRLEPAPKKRPKNYARRLQWTDGTPLDRGWRPTVPHSVKHSARTKPDIHGR
jgi:hypothetical protein